MGGSERKEAKKQQKDTMRTTFHVHSGATLITTLIALASPLLAAGPKPNIVVIVADDKS